MLDESLRVDANQLADSYRKDGFVIVRNLLPQNEVEDYLEHFMALKESGFDPGENNESRLLPDDPLRQWPRLMHPHRRDPKSLGLLLDVRIRSVLRTILGEDALAAQTMFYFKPPGSRGHALHQDQYFLRVDPGTCHACWIALDPADQENGGMRVVPGMGDLPLMCVKQADPAQSWSQITIPLPEDAKAIELELNAGDALFFNGWTPHGSSTNTSADRFRRSFIAHYVPSSARQVSAWYQPLLDFEGREVTRQVSPQGGPCGVWTEDDGKLSLSIIDPDFEQPRKEHE